MFGMNQQDEICSKEDISRCNGYIMMGLSLSCPIILYILIRNVFCYFLDLDSAPIVPWLLLLVANIGLLFFLHIDDIRNIKKVCGSADKLVATVLAFQPMYFACRQDILGRPKKGAIIYAVISTLEVVLMLVVYVVECFRDVVELLL